MLAKLEKTPPISSNDIMKQVLNPKKYKNDIKELTTEYYKTKETNTTETKKLASFMFYPGEGIPGGRGGPGGGSGGGGGRLLYKTSPKIPVKPVNPKQVIPGDKLPPTYGKIENPKVSITPRTKIKTKIEKADTSSLPDKKTRMKILRDKKIREENNKYSTKDRENIQKYQSIENLGVEYIKKKHGIIGEEAVKEYNFKGKKMLREYREWENRNTKSRVNDEG